MKATMHKLLIAASLVVALGCNDDTEGGDGSAAKSIGNAVRTDGAALTTNNCGYAMDAASFASLTVSDKRKLLRITAASDVEKYEATGALLAAPKALHTMFFAADGELIITNDLAGACGNAALSSAETRFATEGTGESVGCWDTSGQRLVVAIKPSAVRHGLVRLFGYIYTQFFVKKLGKSENLPEEYKKEITQGLARYGEQRDAVWTALLKDLATVNPAAKTRLTEAAESDAEGVKNTILGDVIDSRYCSSATDSELETKFPHTYCAFVASSKAMGKDLGEPFHKRSAKVDCSKY